MCACMQSLCYVTFSPLFLPPSSPSPSLPLLLSGKLTKSQIKLGYTALQKIETLIVAGKTSGDALYKACDEFYTRVPHDFG